MSSAYFLDFDGVVVESADIKTDAFYELYLDFGLEVAEYAKSYHLAHQGVNRYHKFKAIAKEFTQISTSDSLNTKLADDFSKIVLDKILKAPFVPFVLEFLEKQKKSNTPLYLLSATPHDELMIISKKRDLLPYFSGIYGAPSEKPIIGEEIIKKHYIDRDGITFVGDSISDFDAAQKLNVSFIGRIVSKEDNPFPENVKTIENFKALIDDSTSV